MEKLYKNSLLIIVLLMIIAVVPRAIELLNHNYLFGYDQGVFFQSVKKIVVDHKLAFIGTEVGGQGGFFQGPGWYYLLAIPFALTNGDPYGAMVVMLFLGVGAVIFSFLFARQMFDWKTGIVVSLLISISPSIILQSRFIWPPFPITFLSVLFLYFLYLVLKGEKRCFPLLTITLGLMSHFETATAATLLVNLLFIMPVVIARKLISFPILLVSFGTLVLTQLPLILFDLKNDFLNTKGIIRLFSSSSWVDQPFSMVFSNRWGVFKDNFLDTFPSGQLLWPVILFIIITGGVMYVRDKRKSFAERSFLIYLFVSAPLFFLIFMKYGSLMWSWWILELNVYYCFLLGIVLVYLWNKTYTAWKPIVGGIILILISSFIYQTFNFYKNDFNDFGGVHKIKGKIQAIDYIYQNAAGKPFNLLVFTPPIYTFAYDYLLWWHGERKYGYKPGEKKQGTFYLLIEPDPHKPWTYNGWLETVIRVGKVVETKELSSGFIVQKRIMEE